MYDGFKKREAENLYLSAADADAAAVEGRPRFGRRKNPSLFTADFDLLKV